MSVKNRFDSSKLLMGTSSPASGTEELSLADRKTNEKKTKRYVKKKGETRKRNSTDGGGLQQFLNSNSSFSLIVPGVKTSSDSTEVVKDVSKKLENMVIGRGINSVELEAENDKKVGKIANEDSSVGGIRKKSRNDKNGEKIREKNVKKVVGKNVGGIAVKREELKGEKKWLKKRKQNSGDGGLQQQQFVDSKSTSSSSSSSSTLSGKTFLPEEVSDDILEKIQNMVIKSEIESPELRAAKEMNYLKLGDENYVSEKTGVLTKLGNDKNGKKEGKKNVMRIEKNLATAVESEKSETGKKFADKKKEKRTTTTTTMTKKKNKEEEEEEESEESEPIRGKKSMIELANDKSEEKCSQKNLCPVKKENIVQQSSKKDVDKGKTEEQRKRDRQTARFAKTVAKFSMKFAEAAKELGIVKPNEDSSSWSTCSESSLTDSSNSSSCSCSDCYTTDSSSCSCSDCCSDKSSTSSSSDSELESSETSSCTSSSLSSWKTI